MRIKPYHILLIVSLSLGLYLVKPLFGPGIPMNTDLPCHYLREWCILNSDWRIPNNWCAFAQSGMPSSQYYFPPVDAAIALLSLLIGLELSYKLMVAFALFAPGIAAWYFLRENGHPMAGSIAFALLLLQRGSWDIGGFEETILVGFWHYMLSVAAWLFVLHFYREFLREPNWKRLSICAIASVFLTHPMTLVMAVFSLAVITISNHKRVLEHPRWVLTLATTTLALNAYYVLPLWMKTEYFPSGGGGTISWELLNNFILRAIPDYLKVLSLLGFIFLLSRWRKERPLFEVYAGTLALVLLNFLNPPPIPFFGVGVRLGAFLAIVLYMSVGLLIECLGRIRIKDLRLPTRFLPLLIGLILAYSLFTVTLPLSNAILLSDSEVFQPAFQAYQGLSAGRLLAEDTLHAGNNHPYFFSHIGCAAPMAGSAEVLGQGVTVFPNIQALQTQNGALFGEKLETYDDEGLRATLEKNNIKYILAFSPAYINHFATRFAAEQRGPFVLFTTDVNPAYFSSDAKLSDERYERIRASVDVETDAEALVEFESNSYSNWRAYLDGEPVDVEDCDGIVCVHVSSGRLEIRYEILWYEYLGYVLTIAALSFLVFRTRTGTSRASS